MSIVTCTATSDPRTQTAPSTVTPPSVAEIAAVGTAGTLYITRAWTKRSTQCPDSAGSGVHLGNGMVLTAAHVLWQPKVGDPCLPTIPGRPFFGPGSEVNTTVNIFARGAIIRAQNSSGSTNTAQLLWSDTFTDLALLSVPNQSRTGVLAWGDSRQLRVGDTVIAVGYPVTGATVTRGIVSALTTVPSPLYSGVLIDLVQTDAAVNPGNSGGALLNDRGELIGIVDFRIEGGNYGLNFAVASTTARRTVDSGGLSLR